MPTVSSFYGILIRMYFNDHAPPHFHARYGDHEGVLRISDLALVEGWLPGRALGSVLRFRTLPGFDARSGMGHDAHRRTDAELGGMPDEAGTSSDQAARIGGSVMYWDVVDVKAEPERRLYLRFRDGLSGYVQLDESDLTGALAPLRDPAFFRQVFIDHGAVAWPGDVDLAPDAIHAEVAGRLSAA